MNRKYAIFEQGATLDYIKKSLKPYKIDKFYDSLSEDIISKNLKKNEAIIFKEISVALVGNVNVPSSFGIREKFIGYEFINEESFEVDERDMFSKPDDEPNNWGIQRVNVLNSNLTGDGVNVAILDTGYDKFHKQFANRKIITKSFISKTAQDFNGHGMHCIGIACGYKDSDGIRYGIAYKSNIYACKVLDDSRKKRGYKADIIRGILWAVKHKCKVINISYGIRNNGKEYDKVFERVIKYAKNKGSITVAAVGNHSIRTNSLCGMECYSIASPSDSPSAIAVSGINEEYDVYSLANQANLYLKQKIDFVAPATNIYSSWSTKSKIKTGSNMIFSGTSMAAAFVSGILALLFEKKPKAKCDEILKILKQNVLSCTDWELQDVGSGLVQIT
ncbi:S8 family peptidase [Spongiimicrobium salis]|uniref:S8 family peptidase n=1 Tax=Spongiimicrobium salis TaxID=1667022 RepID=UPI00374D3B45